MIGLVYCAQAGLERLCKMEVSYHKQSQLAHSTLKLSYNIDLARTKSEAAINKFIIKSNNKLVIHKSVNLRAHM